MANRFSVICTQIKKKPYDFLDQRKQEFAQDYDDFLRQIKELHVSLFTPDSRQSKTLWTIDKCWGQNQKNMCVSGYMKFW